MLVGINAGLCDVVALDRALRGKDILSGKDGEKPKSIREALENYEKVQGPQVSGSCDDLCRARHYSIHGTLTSFLKLPLLSKQHHQHNNTRCEP